MKNALFTVLFLCVLSACSSIRYVNIETYKPAEVTFPGQTGNVLIANNAVPQPDRVGYEYKLMGAVQDTARAKADSALFDACKELGVAILETGYFSDVRLFHEQTRTDSQHLIDEKLSQETVRALCEETGTDAVISIDRLLFDMTRDVSAVGNSFYVGVLDVKIAGVMRAYVPGRETPLATVLLADSVYWTEQGLTMEQLNMFLPTPENALREAGKYIGNLAAPNFVPHWQNEIRWFYTGGSTLWKQATAFASHQKWESAEEVWRMIHDKTADETLKAKSASNIAFAQEMLGNYEVALEWAEKATETFKKKGENSRDYQLLSQYSIALKERIRENRKLNIQFGEI